MENFARDEIVSREGNIFVRRKIPPCKSPSTETEPEVNLFMRFPLSIMPPSATLIRFRAH